MAQELLHFPRVPRFPRVLKADRLDRAPRFDNGQSSPQPSSQPFVRSAPRPKSRWCYDELAGRLTELSTVGAGASLTVAASLVLEAQRKGETAVWVTVSQSTFFPPDVAESGVDLEALPVVRVPDSGAAARACDLLARSGGFGLVIVDLGPVESLSLAAQSRLSGLALKHDVSLVFLTRKRNQQTSLGSMISLRGAPLRKRKAPGLFECQVRILKDKRRGPGWKHSEVFGGLDGLR